MNRTRTIQGLWLLALALLLAGVLLIVGAARHARVVETRLSGRLAAVAELRVLQERAAANEAVRRAFEALPDESSPLRAVLKPCLEQAAEFRELGDGDTIAGWRPRRTELVVNEMPLADLPALVVRAETHRPPWRLAKCDITASARAPGTGRVVLVFEGFVPVGGSDQ